MGKRNVYSDRGNTVLLGIRLIESKIGVSSQQRQGCPKSLATYVEYILGLSAGNDL